MDPFPIVFGVTGAVSPAQECARAAVIFIYGLAVIRLAGRRVFGKWSALDIVVSIVAGSNLSRALTGNSPLLGTLLATTVLMALHWLLARLAALRPGLSHLLEGRPYTLAEGGSLRPGAQLLHAVTEAHLNEALRQAGVARVEETRGILIEPSGRIAVLKRR